MSYFSKITKFVVSFSNKYLQLALDLISVCVCPSFYDKILQYRFSMTHISNSVLAGGIAIGTVANIILEPFYALLIGCLGALVSVLGNSYIRVCFCIKLKHHI